MYSCPCLFAGDENTFAVPNLLHHCSLAERGGLPRPHELHCHCGECSLIAWTLLGTLASRPGQPCKQAQKSASVKDSPVKCKGPSTQHHARPC